MSRSAMAWKAVAAGLLCTALLAGTAEASKAKRWEDLAPAPLASDSTYLALSARSADSLTLKQAAWLDVQRSWRRQRDDEAGGRNSDRGILDIATRHAARPGDARFARLASRPLASLADDEVMWLVVESNAQLADRRQSSNSNAVGLVLFAGIAGAVLVLAIVSRHTIWFP